MAGGMYMDIAHMARHRPQISTGGLDVLAESSQQLQNERMQRFRDVSPQSKHRSNTNIIEGMMPGRQEASTGDANGAGTAHGHIVRRRISRACDQCNQLRTKCDGKSPCAHCVEFGLSCEYARERKKRGKASRKDIAAQQAAVATSSVLVASPGSPGEHLPENAATGTLQRTHQGIKRRRSPDGHAPLPQLPPPGSGSIVRQLYRPGHHASRPNLEQTVGPTPNSPGGRDGQDQQWRRGSNFEAPAPAFGAPMAGLPRANSSDRGMSATMGDYGIVDDYHRNVLHPGTAVAGHNISPSSSSTLQNPMNHGGSGLGYGETTYAAPSPRSQNSVLGGPFKIGESPPSAGLFGQSPVMGSPGWLPLPSPSATLNPPPNQVLRYPVLRPLLPHISAIIPIGLACDLLELYFSSTSSVFLHPSSPYVLGYIFRKRSFLRPRNPRVCSPALLASMLWIGAQTSESPFLTSPPSARRKVCQKLLDLTYGLLKPLIHTASETSGSQNARTGSNGVVLGGFGMVSDEMDTGLPVATGAVDDVATYIHLATVVSASEYKAASLRWWNAALSLARELKLGRELPPLSGPGGEAGASGEHVDGSGGRDPSETPEEEREERRRLWWLLYIVDRHIALCYNKPLFLLDLECEGLLQPEDEDVWQAGEFYPPADHARNTYFRSRGPVFVCSGYSIFSHFLPLMTILGAIVDMKHAQDHPRFGLILRNADSWNAHVAEISRQLDAYGRSLKDLEAYNRSLTDFAANEATGNGNGQHQHYPNRATAPSHTAVTDNSTHRMTGPLLRTKIAVAYGTHLMHTLHILLNGKWDPISLLDDNDLWISSDNFISATGHAVEAAAAIDEILEYDPDLSFMPFFFGIYLLQGSFLLLLIADKLQGEASPSVVKACETIVRAHEACVVTLNTEYQRNFRKVMRSALSQVRGRSLEDQGDQQLRRREVLALYRWTGDGTGLAL